MVQDTVYGLLPQQIRLESCSYENPWRNLEQCFLHSLIVRAAATLWYHPIDNLIWIGDVAGLAVHAICKIYFELQAVFLACNPRTIDIFCHFIDGGGTKILARIAVFLDASCDADVGVQH